MKTRSSLLVGAALIGLAGALALWLSVADQSPPPIGTADGQTSPDATASNTPLFGSERVYAVSFQQSIWFEKPRANGADDTPATKEDAIDSGIEGTLSITRYSTDAGRLRLRAELTNTKVSINGETVDYAALQTDLAKPFSFETDLSGKVLELAFDDAVSPIARGLLKSLIAAGQAVVEPGEKWTTLEQDTTGEYEARYERDAKDRNLVRKQRLRYLRIAGPQGLRPAAETGDVSLKDDTTIRFVNDALTEIDSTSRIDMAFGEAMPRVYSSTALTMRLQRTAAQVAVRNDWNVQHKEAMASEPSQVDAASRQREADENTLQDATLEDLEKELADKADAGHRARAEVMERLKAAFRLRPEDTRKAVEYVKRASPDDGRAITAALGGADTQEALRALADIGRSSETPVEVRTNAITALAISKVPSPETVQALTQMIADVDPMVSGTATLALGGAASAVRDSDRGAYENAMSTLITGETTAQSAQQKALYMRALGNAGDPRVLPLAQEAATSDDVELRLAAVTAVRFVPGAEADALLARAMQSDPEASVRVLAIETVEGFRAIAGFVPTFAIVLTNDAMPQVRYAALHALNVIKTAPEALPLIQSAAQNDPVNDVRQFAQAILDSLAPGAQP